jgi:hypothetical protein
MRHLKHDAFPQLPARCRARQVLMLPNATAVSEICQWPCSAEMACSGVGYPSPGLACNAIKEAQSNVMGQTETRGAKRALDSDHPIHLSRWMLQ